jgi:hypothetical protein
MSLINRSQNCSQRILELDALEERSNYAHLFERRANDLRNPVNELSSLNSVTQLFIDRNVEVPNLDQALISTLSDRISNLLNRYIADRNVILDPFPEEDFRYVVTTPLNSLPGKVQTSLLSAWQEWSKQIVPEINADILDVLYLIPSLQHSVTSIRNLKVRINAILNTLPKSEDDFNNLETLSQLFAGEWTALTGEGIPDNVLSFLRTSGGREGAPYSSLTPEVLTWLINHNILESLKIRVG